MFDAFTPSASDVGFVIDWFPTETIRPTESLHDGGIIIEGGFPTETIRPMESLHDGGIIDGFTDPWLSPTETIFPTETIRPMESLDDGGIIIIGGFPTETIRPMESLHHFEVLI